MIWDSLILLAVLALVVAGWTVGLMNSWRGVIAIVVASVVTKNYYIDFATWIVQQLLIKPEFATLMAYFMMWIVVEIVAETMMMLFLPWNKKGHPGVLDKFGGVGLALVKWFFVCTFPLMAMLAPNKVPAPPSAAKPVIHQEKLGLDKSTFISDFKSIATGLLPSYGSLVTSTQAPTFKPNFKAAQVHVD